jgi:GTP cyclohydrolase II
MIVGEVEGQADVLCRVHDQCQTSEVFGSLRCDCKEQLDFALSKIQKEGGMVLYLPQEGRGIGLANKVAAYAAQELGLDTVDANRHLGLPDDAREYYAVRDILNDLKISSIRLMTNNPRKINELTSLGINVSARVPIVTPPNSDFSLAYVKAKKERMFHMFDSPEESDATVKVQVTTTTTTTTATVVNEQ